MVEDDSRCDIIVEGTVEKKARIANITEKMNRKLYRVPTPLKNPKIF